MATTPRVADRQVTASSISATEKVKLWRSGSFMERTTWRRSLRELACSMRSSRVRWATGMTCAASYGGQRDRFPGRDSPGCFIVARSWSGTAGSLRARNDLRCSAQESEGNDGFAGVAGFSDELFFECV